MRITAFGVDLSGIGSPGDQGPVSHQALENRIRLLPGLLEIGPLRSRHRPERHVSVMGLLLGRGSRGYERRDRQRAHDSQNGDASLDHAMPPIAKLPAPRGDRFTCIARSALL